MGYIFINAVNYLSKVPSHVKVSDFPLTKMDSNALESFQNRIELFKGVKMKEIAFLTKNFDTLNFFRGCRVGCSHCPKNAVAPKFNRESVLYEDLVRFVKGFRSLNERLGFNIFNGNKAIHISDDSDFIGFDIKGTKNKHSVSEAIELIYNGIKIPAILETSGWDHIKGRSVGYRRDSNAAKQFVGMAKKNPDAVKEVRVSINPFVDSNDYAGRMANTLYTFLDLFKTGKATIVYKHAPDGNPGFDAEALKKIYKKIFKELQDLSGSKLEGFPQLSPEVVSAPSKSHIIEPTGRGSKYFPDGKAVLQAKLEKDAYQWGFFTENERYQNLLNTGKKRIDIDGSVYVAKPTKITYSGLPVEIMIPTNIRLNYTNQNKPHKIFTEYEYK